MRLAVTVIALALAAPQLASAQETTGDLAAADLRVKHLPTPEPGDLGMRVAARKSAPAIAVPMAAAAADTDVSTDASTESSVDTSYRMFPNDWRDVEERVIFKVNLGYGLDGAGTTGDPQKNGTIPDDVTDPRGDGFAGSRSYLLGDAVLGTRGVLLPSMDTYFLSRYALSADGASQFAALNSVYDQRDGRAILVRSAYAEVDDMGEEGTLLGNLFLRAGRQFRYGASTFITNFDGLSAGYDGPGFEVNGFFGRRVSMYFADDPGLLGGAGFKLRGKDMFNVPVDFAVDYLFFDGGGRSDDGDPALDDLSLARQYLELSTRAKVAGWRVNLQGRLVNNGDLRTDEIGEAEGFGLGRIGIELRRAFGRNMVIIGNVAQKFAREVAYDYINPAANDVLDVATTLGIGLDAPADSTALGLRASYMVSRALELYGFGRANLVSGDSQSGFNRSWQEAGIAAGHRSGRKLWTTAQYKLRLTSLDGDANVAGTEFFDTSGSGVTSFHEVSAESRYSTGYRMMTAAAGIYYRVYNLQSPYAEVETDGRGGVRLDGDYWFSKYTRAKLAGEFAQPSPAFAPELGNLYSIRLLMEASF